MLRTSKNSPELREEFAKRLETVKQRIVKQFQPNRVVLFGSVAKNSFNDWSDIDLLIVMPTKKNPLERNRDVLELTMDDVPNVESIVLTPEEYSIAKKRVAHIAAIAEREGKVIYEKK